MFSKTDKGTGDSAGTETPQKPAAPSIISVDLHIVGDISSEGEIHIDGCVDGTVRSKTLLVGETAVVKGEIDVDSARVHGTVNGQIKARTVDLARSAHVNGDIFHENLLIERGAFLEGHCRHIDDKKEAAEGRINLVVKDSGSLVSEAKDDGEQKAPAQS